MFRHLLYKEILTHLMSLRFALAALLCAAVVISGIMVRSESFYRSLNDYNHAYALQTAREKKLDHPSAIVWNGLRLHLKPEPLQVFAQGVDERRGLTVSINAHQLPKVLAQGWIDPVAALFPGMDLVNFIGIVMSLMAIVFGYDTVCGEKEDGTLRLMLSYPVPRDLVLIAKWVGGFAVLLIPLLCAVIAGVALVMQQGLLTLGAGQWWRLTVIVGLGVIYLAVIYTATVWVSCLAKRGATSIMLLVSMWLLMVLAIPVLCPYLARVLVPAPSFVATERDRWSLAADRWEWEVRRKLAEYDRSHGFGRRWWRAIDWRQWNSRKLAVERRLYETRRLHYAARERHRIFTRFDRKYRVAVAGQLELTRWLTRFSPFSCFTIAAAEIAGTGPRSRMRFLQRLAGHQKTLIDYGFGEWEKLLEYELEHQGRTRDWRRSHSPIPEFRQEPPAGAGLMRMVLFDVCALGFMLATFGMLGYLAFRNYDVR